MTYAKRGRRRVERRELVHDYPHPPVEVLRKAGAPQHVIDVVYARWAALGPEERRQSGQDIVAAKPDELAAAIADMEIFAAWVAAGHDARTDPPLEFDLDNPAELLDMVPNGTVDETVMWVDDWSHPAIGALGALAVELRKPEGHRRRTLIDALKSRVG